MNKTKIKALIKKGEIETGLKGYDLLNISRATWFRRLNNPEDFKLGELLILIDCLGIDGKELIECGNS